MRLPIVALYIVAFAAAVTLDAVTPLSIADWLIEVILVWIASVRGSTREMVLVASVGTGAIALGFWLSPDLLGSLWVAVVNRSAAVGVIWMMVAVGWKRGRAEDARRHVTEQLSVLEGLLPICAACKAIRDDVGRWHRLESYLSAHSKVKLTHSLCPPCADKYSSDLYGNTKD